MKLVSLLAWSWRALRGRSVTFAGLFAASVLGWSVITGFRHLLSRLGAPWYVWLVAPTLLIGYLAKKEQEWLPDPVLRGRWARRVLLASLTLLALLTLLRPARRPQPPLPRPAAGR